MMMDWEAYRKELFATIQQIGQTGPDIVRGYRVIADGAVKTASSIPRRASSSRSPSRLPPVAMDASLLTSTRPCGTALLATN